MSRGVRHGVSDHVSGDRPRGAVQALMAADRLHAGRDYAWRGARRIILRSGDIAVRNSPAAGRRVRVCAVVTSDGIGGTDGLGGTVPLFVTSDGIGGTDGLGGAVPLFVTSHGIGGTNGFGGAVPLGDGRGRVVAGRYPERIRVGCGWFGHGVFPWQVGARRSVLGGRWLAAGRNAATEDGRARGR